MAQTFDGKRFGRLRASAALAKGVLVKLSSGKLAAAGLGEEFIGIMETDAFADLDEATITLRNAPGTVLCKASAAITAGAVVYGRASGLVDDNSGTSAVRVGIALEAATAANDLVEVLQC